MNPPTAQELLDQCLQYLQQGNTEEAIKLLQEIQSLPLTTRQQAIFWFCYGIAYRDKKDYDKAIEAYQEAIRLQPDFAEAHYNLGATYYNIEISYSQSINLTKAKQYARQASRHDPYYPDPWAMLAIISTHPSEGKYQQAQGQWYRYEYLSRQADQSIAWYLNVILKFFREADAPFFLYRIITQYPVIGELHSWQNLVHETLAQVQPLQRWLSAWCPTSGCIALAGCQSAGGRAFLRR